MTSQPWLAEYLGQGAREPGPYAPDAASADAARRLRALLADPDGWAEPPAGLLGQILAGVDSERVRPAAPPRPRMRRTVRAGAVALLAAAAVVISLVVTRGPATSDVVLAGTRLAPGASATAQLHTTPSGLAIELDVSGLPPSPPGSYYQAWMKGPRGLVTIGTFHLRGGPGTVELWSAVSLADYPAITVTREPEDGNPASSGQVVLTNRP
ncbi:MAG TPA: anti-sigma factor [Streptosporangiaceae bacterium]|nr:anti-sigma factor [Streptosporangiaceae bacterium]